MAKGTTTTLNINFNQLNDLLRSRVLEFTDETMSNNSNLVQKVQYSRNPSNLGLEGFKTKPEHVHKYSFFSANSPFPRSPCQKMPNDFKPSPAFVPKKLFPEALTFTNSIKVFNQKAKNNFPDCYFQFTTSNHPQQSHTRSELTHHCEEVLNSL